LWEALKEYPEARRMLIEKGRQMLRKDNLLDDDEPTTERSTAAAIARVARTTCWTRRCGPRNVRHL